MNIHCNIKINEKNIYTSHWS